MLGFIPWCFELPDKGYEEAWEQIVNPEGFASPPPVALQLRNRDIHGTEADYECLWNGPS
ncbi:hypothetical protein [Blautia sp.]|uniref:MGH1-like glycoside hydrolase domain-containing protein n=1 Tax=Blautia TaxID=572511 RepID=UPI0035228EB1